MHFHGCINYIGVFGDLGSQGGAVQCEIVERSCSKHQSFLDGLFWGL